MKPLREKCGTQAINVYLTETIPVCALLIVVLVVDHFVQQLNAVNFSFSLVQSSELHDCILDICKRVEFPALDLSPTSKSMASFNFTQAFVNNDIEFLVPEIPQRSPARAKRARQERHTKIPSSDD